MQDPEQVRALRTPTRFRVLNALLELGPCSVADIARRLDWKPGSLYYHVKALERVGLVRRVGERSGDHRSEALYEAAARAIVLDRENRTPEYLAAIWDTYRAALRASERDLERVLRQEAEGSGPRHKTMLEQTTVRLDGANADRVRRLLEEVHAVALASEDPEGDETVFLTTALARES